MDTTDYTTRIKLVIYGHFADTGEAPTPEIVADRVESSLSDVLTAFQALQEQRVLVLDKDRKSIRMAPPFSGVVTQHTAESQGVRYYANCAWDALGIAAALRRRAIIRSTCGQSGDALVLNVSEDGPERTQWVFHCLVPAARWWEDIVFT